MCHDPEKPEHVSPSSGGCYWWQYGAEQDNGVHNQKEFLETIPIDSKTKESFISERLLL
jgi:hypothetical protein